MRFIGLDVHRDFCEVVISEGGKARRAGRVAARPAELELFGQSLGSDDRVVLEATGNGSRSCASWGAGSYVARSGLPRMRRSGGGARIAVRV